MAPQLILLWTKEEIDFCMKYELFIEGMKWKYKMAVEKCNVMANFKTEKEKYYPEETPLF